MSELRDMGDIKSLQSSHTVHGYLPPTDEGNPHMTTRIMKSANHETMSIFLMWILFVRGDASDNMYQVICVSELP